MPDDDRRQRWEIRLHRGLLGQWIATVFDHQLTAVELWSYSGRPVAIRRARSRAEAIVRATAYCNQAYQAEADLPDRIWYGPDIPTMPRVQDGPAPGAA
jgi:hypothetical protein